MGFAPSLIAFGWSRSLIQAFYTQGDSRTPVLVGIVVVMVNAVLGWLLLGFNVVGLAATLSVSSFIQFMLLIYCFKRKFVGARLNFLSSFSFHVGISFIACFVGMLIAPMADFNDGFSIRNALVLLLLSFFSALTYFAFAYFFKLPEARKLIDGLLARLLKRDKI